MKLTPEQLKLLKPSQKLWYFDHRLGTKNPKEAVLKKWDHPTRLLLHIFEDGELVEGFPWSLTTNGPTGQLRMTVNPKQWLTIRD